MIDYLLSPDWQEKRAAIMAALDPYPDAKKAVERRLAPLEEAAAAKVRADLRRDLLTEIQQNRDN
jgi:hypothetical protein